MPHVRDQPRGPTVSVRRLSRKPRRVRGGSPHKPIRHSRARCRQRKSLTRSLAGRHSPFSVPLTLKSLSHKALSRSARCDCPKGSGRLSLDKANHSMLSALMLAAAIIGGRRIRGSGAETEAGTAWRPIRAMSCWRSRQRCPRRRSSSTGRTIIPTCLGDPFSADMRLRSAGLGEWRAYGDERSRVPRILADRGAGKVVELPDSLAV